MLRALRIASAFLAASSSALAVALFAAFRTFCFAASTCVTAARREKNPMASATIGPRTATNDVAIAAIAPAAAAIDATRAVNADASVTPTTSASPRRTGVNRVNMPDRASNFDPQLSASSAVLVRERPTLSITRDAPFMSRNRSGAAPLACDWRSFDAALKASCSAFRRVSAPRCCWLAVWSLTLASSLAIVMRRLDSFAWASVSSFWIVAKNSCWFSSNACCSRTSSLRTPAALRTLGSTVNFRFWIWSRFFCTSSRSAIRSSTESDSYLSANSCLSNRANRRWSSEIFPDAAEASSPNALTAPRDLEKLLRVWSRPLPSKVDVTRTTMSL